MSTDWTMPRRADVCTRCQRAFDVGETFQAYLYESSEGYERQDYCTGCAPPSDRPPVGAWKTRRAEPAARRGLTFDRQTVYGFFEGLSDIQEPRQVQLRFVLALLLWRKRVLRLERTDNGADGETWKFVHPASGTAHQVLRPELDEEQLERLSAQLEQLLADGSGPLETAAADPGREPADG